MRRRDEKFPDNGFEAWGGYMQAKIAKLEEQFCQRAGNDQKLSQIFDGVSIYVNGFTIPSADELKDLMSKHGGVYHIYQKSEDFVIASNLPDTKVKNMSLAKVVKPEWITDSIASNKLLDYKDYLLFRHSRTQRKIEFLKNKSKGDTSKSEHNVKCLTEQQFITDEINESDILKQNIPTNHSKNVETLIKTAADPNFISEFYNNSRLHHISQLGACFKQYVNDLRENNKFMFPARTQLKSRFLSLHLPMNSSQLYFERGKIIMHIDMDCFFVSVGLRTRPDLRGKPVAVTHSKGKQTHPKRQGVDRNTEFNLYKQKYAQKYSKPGENERTKIESRVDNIGDEGAKFGSMSEIASCSYEARAKGVSNGMFMGPALRLCPELQTIPYDFEGYKEVAYTLYDTIAQYTLDIEAVSCDEMYVDCTELINDINMSVQDFATSLRSEIKEKTGCPCSTGFGGNRLQARLATKKAKPDGQFFLTADLVEDFMVGIKLKDLPGVGRQTAYKLESLGHQTCGSLQNLTLVTLQHHLGNKTGAQLFDQCRGRDSNPLSYHTIRKSVSAEVNYGIRFENTEQCLEFLKQLCMEVQTRMQQFKVLGKCITLKLMVRDERAPVETAKFMGHGFCNIINKSTSLTTATNSSEVIAREVVSLYKKINIDAKEMRGIGIQITKLETINANQNKGAISKFLSSHKPVNDNNAGNDNKTSIDYKSVLGSLKSVTSPKKTLIVSPLKQKSPVLGVARSPIRRRGRPRKCNTSTSRNLMNKFLQGQTIPFRDIPYKDPMVKKVEIDKERVCDKVEAEDQKGQGLLGLSWQKVRELLRAWLDSEQTPLPCDVSMLCEYMRTMVVERKIDNLNILVNFLKRRINEINSASWIEVYTHIMEQVQNAMLAIYGKSLYID
ncbi:unnamed protein product [Diatraea saccharalis]|uniref:DNA repair protein REV1 n=1 Tax=Diatraea saccharalis TaxID=40085 RepID=A0A9N9R2N6_9NEOP|nr:unnamed protein product [Diatraea saccharalis]